MNPNRGVRMARMSGDLVLCGWSGERRHVLGRAVVARAPLTGEEIRVLRLHATHTPLNPKRLVWGVSKAADSRRGRGLDATTYAAKYLPRTRLIIGAAETAAWFYRNLAAGDLADPYDARRTVRSHRPEVEPPVIIQCPTCRKWSRVAPALLGEVESP
jgi:hypothetical protein